MIRTAQGGVELCRSFFGHGRTMLGRAGVHESHGWRALGYRRHEPTST